MVNSLGSGILESPGLRRFLPELSELLLGESPLLESPQHYWAGIDAERSHLLSRLESLLIKSTVGEQTIVGPVLSAAERAELGARIEAAPWQWVGQELPQFSTAPTGHFAAACRRPASVCGCSQWRSEAVTRRWSVGWATCSARGPARSSSTR